MELKRYFRIMRRHWLIMLFTFVVVVGATLYLVLPQPWIYQSTTTLQIGPSSKLTNPDDIAKVQAALSVEIAATYATQARSASIGGQARGGQCNAGPGTVPSADAGGAASAPRRAQAPRRCRCRPASASHAGRPAGPGRPGLR